MKSHYYSLDICRFVMAIIVVMIHTLVVNNIYFHRILELAVPFFFIVSGFFLENKICPPQFDYRYNKIVILPKLWKWVLRFIKMYFIWTLVFIPIECYGYYINDYSLKSVAISFIKQFFLVGGGQFSYHLWYLLASIVGGLILIVFVKMKLKFISILIISILLWGIGLLLNIYHPTLYFNFLFTTRNGLFVGLSLIVVGMGIKRIESLLLDNKIKSIMCSLIAQSIFFLYGGGFVLLGGAGILILILALPQINVNGNCCFLFRKASTGIYLIHVLFVDVLLLFYKFELGVPLFLIVSLLSILFSIVYAFRVQRSYTKI